MKKFLLILLFPIFVLAYSNNIIPGGETIGIDINSDGLIVIGLYKIDNKYINNYFKVGDKIVSVNDIKVYNSNDLVSAIGDDTDNVKVTYVRGDKTYTDKLRFKLVDGSYKTGLYIKNNTIGIGTLTYIDNDTMIYGSLGHVINDSKSGVVIDIKDGFSYDARISSFTRSVDGNPGSKNADIIKDNLFGSIVSNTNYGIYGFVYNKSNKERIEVSDNINVGKAYILTSDLNNDVNEYEINIIKVDKKNKDKSIYFEVLSHELLDMSGGIVQGMSGSPIIQDGKLIGCVTRVLVDDVSKGYGISIITMLEEGDKILR